MTVLVDTCVWVQHPREGNTHLAELLIMGSVACHPFIVGECALGSLKNRGEILALMQALPMTPRLEDREVLLFIDASKIASRGIGLVDVHLAASARLAGIPLWTADKKLATVADDLKISYSPNR